MTAVRIAVLVKQVPRFEAMALGPDGRLRRDGVDLELNPYCRRAVTAAVELVAACGAGEVVVATMGPPAAEDCLREAIACGADRGVLLSDPALGGSDTLATASALARLVTRLGEFDLVLVGKNSVDSDTGQVGPELAELMDWPFAGPCRELEVDFEAATFGARCETDEGHRSIEGELPAVMSCAERLTDPAKAVPADRARVPADRITHLNAGDLGPGPWGAAGSPTAVGAVRTLAAHRDPVVLDGAVAAQVDAAIGILTARGAFDAAAPAGFAPRTAEVAHVEVAGAREVWALVDPARPRLAHELGQEAARLAAVLGFGARVVSLGPGLDAVPPGISGLTILDADPVAADEDYARVLARLVADAAPWGMLAPGTARGREIASRVAAAGGHGLGGDAVELDVGADGALIAWKPAFGGSLVAAITSKSPVQMATVRPGVLHASGPVAAALPPVQTVGVAATGRVRVVAQEVDDDGEALTLAHAVVCVGVGVEREEYAELSRLVEALGAELGATRKVTDRGWMPHSRQIGITGIAVAPRLLVSIGASGKFNHASGFRAAGSVLAVNHDTDAPVFGHCDVGITGDWHEVVPLLVRALP
ncbi:MAG: FAD-binding protein [Acidimicrobiia bacterium]